MTDVVVFSGLKSQLSYGSKCAEKFKEVLNFLGKTLLKQTTSKDEFDANGNIIVRPGFEHAHVLANKLHTMKEILHPSDAKPVRDALLKSSENLFQELVNSIGVFDNTFIGKKYLKRENSDWKDNQNLERDRTRNSNIDAVNMTLDIVSGAKQYSSVIFELVEFEKTWKKYPTSSGQLSGCAVDYDFCKAMTNIADKRNTISQMVKKPVDTTATLNISMKEPVCHALKSNIRFQFIRFIPRKILHKKRAIN